MRKWRKGEPMIKSFICKKEENLDEKNKVQSKIAEAHPMSALAKEMGTRSTKQIKTEQVVKKHRARQNAKNK